MEWMPANTAESATWYGHTRLEPDAPIAAGQWGTWTITYIIGRYGVDNGGRIRVAMRLASDWATPQMEHPDQPHYLTVRTDGDAKLQAVHDPHAHYRPWFHVITIHVYDGYLEEGDRVRITFGDTAGQGAGTRAQTFRERAFEFRVLVESFETNVFVRIPSSPTLRIHGGDAARLVLLAPTQVVAECPFSLVIKGEDAWGNPAESFCGRVRIEAPPGIEGCPEAVVFTSADGGVKRLENLRARPGDHRVGAREIDGALTARSNPIRCLDDNPRFHLFWGDLHGQTDSTVGTGSVAEYFTFARDVGVVDVSTHQGNDFQITRENWADICRHTREFHEPNRFVTFLGYEWSGNTPAGGDHNVIYYRDDQPIYRSSHWQIPDHSDRDTDRYPITKLYEQLAHDDALIIPHIGGRRANPDLHDPHLEPLIEICSVHGRFEWFLWEALERGHRVGVIGAGDDHTGRPGASYGTDASFGVRGGLAGILARSLTREDIWEALRARRTYATTGERILLDVRCNGHRMGAAFAAETPPAITVRVRGTGPLDSVEILRGRVPLYTHPLVEPHGHTPNRIRIVWSGARLKTRGRHTRWDGRLQIEDGKFGKPQAFAFDNPRQGITGSTPHLITWTSITSGDLDGLVVPLIDAQGAVCTFETEPISFRFHPRDLTPEPRVWDAGGVQQKVAVSLDREQPGPASTAFTFTDTSPEKGVNPYYVRVTQEDGEMAWSSPIYVEWSP